MTDDFSSPPKFQPLRQPPPLPNLEASDAAPSPRRSRWGTFVAWTIIVVLSSLIAVGQSLRGKNDEDDPAPQAGTASGSFIIDFQARYIVGAAAFAPQQKAAFLEQARAINSGPVHQRLLYVTLAGELDGPAEAIVALDGLASDMADHEIEPTDLQTATGDALRRLYQQREDGPDNASPDQADQDLLSSQLGWYGQLALYPDGSEKSQRSAVLEPAMRVFVVMIGTVMGLGGAALLGLAGLVGLAVAFGTGNLRPKLSDPTGHDGFYAETFAVWLVLFIGMSLAPALLASQVDFSGYGLLINLAMSFLSLSALAWPVMRGVPWRQVRSEIGWNAGQRPLLEPFCGLASYAMLLPLLGVGMLLTLILIGWQNSGLDGGFKPTNMPSHPIVPLLAGSNWWIKVQVLLLASVAAPIVEETMFRGVLYRHLRDACGRLGFWSNVGLSAGISSFVFAVIHPQGLTTVPALMAIAFGLCLAREWRGTLIPGIVAHGLHNGLLMTLLMTFSKAT